MNSILTVGHGVALYRITLKVKPKTSWIVKHPIMRRICPFAHPKPPKIIPDVFGTWIFGLKLWFVVDKDLRIIPNCK